MERILARRQAAAEGSGSTGGSILAQCHDALYFGRSFSSTMAPYRLKLWGGWGGERGCGGRGAGPGEMSCRRVDHEGWACGRMQSLLLLLLLLLHLLLMT